MREYKKVISTYTTDKQEKCTCDKCGNICEYIDDTFEVDKSTNIRINPYYAIDVDIYLDLCHQCTKELLKWFPRTKEIDNFETQIDIWIENE